MGAIRPIIETCEVHKLAQGTVLMTPQAHTHTLFLVLSGRLRIFLETTEGEAIAYVEAGDYVGELSLIDGLPPSARVVSEDNVVVMVIKEETFWRLLFVSPQITKNMLNTLAQRIRRSNRTLKNSLELSQEYKMHAYMDALTHLYNRRWLNDLLPRQIQRSSIVKEPLSLMMIDIDHFKQFNDRFGHSTGDAAIRHIAQLLSTHVRPADWVARYGGEEFTIILQNTALEEAVSSANRLCQIAAHLPFLPTNTAVPISIGVSQLHAHQDMAALIDASDRALYLAKQNGRSRVEWL